MNFKVFRNLVLFFSYIILGFFLFIIIPWGIYGFYLDLMIKNRINGKIWNLPTIIYGRTINLEPNMILSKNSMVNLLQAIQYRKVSKITRSGEFIVHDDSIELVRRFFSFPNGLKEEAHVFLFFKKEKLIQIYNKKTKRDFGLFCLDPRIISILYSPNRQQRLFLPKSEFPDTLINMLLAIEDRYFYQHDGIKLSSIGRAFLKNIIAKKTVQGGSTLTQQLVKNLFLSNEKSLWRKFNEIYMALILNQRCSKDRILELYLNEIYFGQNGDDQIRGFPLASFYYFGRPVSELSLDQQAMLVGMIKGASLYNPWRNPQITLERRNLILKLLNKQKIINSDLYNTLVLRSMGVQSKDIASISQPAFTEIVCAEVNSTLDNFYQNFSGMKVFTTLDSVSQESAEKAMVHGITQLRNYYNINDLEGAIIVVDRFTGELRATVSGFNLHFSGFNRVLNARRSIGSLIKPAICLAALSNPNKFHLNTWISGKPIVLKQSTGVLWSPKNYNRKFCEKVTLIDSLIKSINVPIVRLGLSIGLSSISDFLIKLGVQPYLISTFPSILLGSINLTPMEVAQKFQTIASGGKRSCLSTVNYITDENNIILFKNFIKTERVVSPQASYLTLYAMQQASIKGTSRVLFSEFSHLNIAGKTGTTNDLRDSWFVGIDGREVVVIWVGRDNNASTKLTGSSGALELYRLYLKYQNNVLPLNLVPPIGIFEISSWEYENFFSLDEKNINKNDVLPIWVSDCNLLNIYSRK